MAAVLLGEGLMSIRLFTAMTAGLLAAFYSGCGGRSSGTDPSRDEDVIPSPDEYGSGMACVDATVSYEKGINSPDSMGSTIIIPKGTKGRVVGQFNFAARNCAKNDFFYFVSLQLKIQRDDPNIILKNIEMVYDENRNGAVDPDEPVVAHKEVIDSTGVLLVLDPQKSSFAGSEEHYFVIRADVDFAIARVPGGASFRFIIESEESFSFSGAGVAKPDGAAINFADFLVEPTENYFIVTRGDNDPVPPKIPVRTEVNKDIPVLQLRTKALDAANRIRRIRIGIPSDDYVTFGTGIRSVSIYLDLGGDGILDPMIEEERVPIEKIDEFDDEFDVTFESEGLANKLHYSEGQEIFLVVKAHFGLMSNDKAKIELNRGAVLLEDTSKKVEGLPVFSKEFYIVDLEE